MTTPPARGHGFAALLSALALLAFLPACSGGGSGVSSATGDRPSPAEAPLGVWSQITDRVARDGDVTKETALRAFAVAFGPLPGVDAPERDDSVPYFLDEPVAWILRYWDSLTAEQQDAVRDAVQPPVTADEERPAVVGKSRPTIRAARNIGELGRLARDYRDDIAARLGSPLGGDITVRFVLAYSFDGAWASTEATEYPLLGRSDCTINIAGRMRAMSDREQRASIAHEVFHCFQLDRFPGSLPEYATVPGWVREGTAAWVGETLAGGTSLSRSWWDLYLHGFSERRVYPLYLADGYTAIGFYSHLANSGVDVWGRLAALVTSSSTDDAALFGVATTGAPSDFLATWAAGSVRNGAWGTAWDTRGPGITDARREANTVVPERGGATFQVGAAQNRVVEVTPADDVLRFRAGGEGMARWGTAGGEFQFSAGTTRDWCLLGRCVCPDGRPPRDLTLTPAPSGARDLWIALAGGASAGGTVTVSAHGMDELCEPTPTTATTGAHEGAWAEIGGAHPLVAEGGECEMDGTTFVLHIGTVRTDGYVNIIQDNPQPGPNRDGGVFWHLDGVPFAIGANRVVITFADDLRSGTFEGQGADPRLVGPQAATFPASGVFGCDGTSPAP